MRLKLKGLNQKQSAAILFFLGLILGIIFANVCRRYYTNDMKVLDYSYHTVMEQQEIDHVGLLKYTLLNNGKEFLVYWVFCFTLFGVPYVILSLIYKGFEVGFIISAVTILYGTKGILLFFSYIMPQALLYVPVMLLCLQKGYQLAQYSYYRSRNRVEMRSSLLLEYLAMIAILLLMLFVGSLLETYLGSLLLKRTLSLCL